LLMLQLKRHIRKNEKSIGMKFLQAKKHSIKQESGYPKKLLNL